MLSKENYDKLDIHYHCRNWTFKCHKWEDKNGYYANMNDTYFGDTAIKVTNQNIDKFEIVFDCREVEKTNCPEEYDDNDLFHAATDSGGYSCGRLDWVRKCAKKSKEKLIYKTKNEIESAKRQLKSAERELQELIDGTHWKLKY